MAHAKYACFFGIPRDFKHFQDWFFVSSVYSKRVNIFVKSAIIRDSEKDSHL